MSNTKSTFPCRKMGVPGVAVAVGEGVKVGVAVGGMGVGVGEGVTVGVAVGGREVAVGGIVGLSVAVGDGVGRGAQAVAMRASRASPNHPWRARRKTVERRMEKTPRGRQTIKKRGSDILLPLRPTAKSGIIEGEHS
ncbi:MAG TPA: hypothetical protein ENJ54_01330 [Chloroflexi bacterium]|nr:hypothetical protein [Chloroflexota bacterium]